MGCLVSSLVQLMCDPHCRTRHGFQGLVQKEWVMAGHRFHSRMNYQRDNDKEEASVPAPCVSIASGGHSQLRRVCSALPSRRLRCSCSSWTVFGSCCPSIPLASS